MYVQFQSQKQFHFKQFSLAYKNSSILIFEECGVHLKCHYFQANSGQEW